MYHVIEAAVIALFSVILYWMMVLAPPEIKEAFVSHNQIEMPEVKKKKRKSPSAHYKPQTGALRFNYNHNHNIFLIPEIYK